MKLVILTACRSAHGSTEILSGFRHENLGPKRNNYALFLDGLLAKRKAEQKLRQSPIIPVPAARYGGPQSMPTPAHPSRLLNITLIVTLCISALVFGQDASPKTRLTVQQAISLRRLN